MGSIQGGVPPPGVNLALMITMMIMMMISTCVFKVANKGLSLKYHDIILSVAGDKRVPMALLGELF